jgi:hypothetical protein
MAHHKHWHLRVTVPANHPDWRVLIAVLTHLCLEVSRWVPVRVVDDDSVGRLQVESKATSTRRQDENLEPFRTKIDESEESEESEEGKESQVSEVSKESEESEASEGGQKSKEREESEERHDSKVSEESRQESEESQQ